MNTPSNLSELVELAVQRRDMSGRKLAEFAHGHGLKISSASINQLRKGHYPYRPSDDTLRTLAWLAEVPDEVAFAAASRPVPGPPFAELLPEGVDHLPQRKQRILIDLANALIEDEAELSRERAQGSSRDAAMGERNEAALVYAAWHNLRLAVTLREAARRDDDAAVLREAEETIAAQLDVLEHLGEDVTDFRAGREDVALAAHVDWPTAHGRDDAGTVVDLERDAPPPDESDLPVWERTTAARRGTSRLHDIRRRQDEASEASQDPGGDDPA